MPKLRIGDVELNYLEAGSGPPLVLLHGLGGSSMDWEPQVLAFAKKHRIIAPDLRGFGQSNRGTKACTVPLMAQDLAALLKRLRVDQHVLVGHSMGGAVGLQYALEHAASVTRLVIANSVPTFQPRTPRQRFEVGYRLLVMGLLGPARLAEIGARRMYPGQPELQAQTIARSVANNTRGAYLAALRALTRWSVLERLGELKMPALVMASEHDYFSRADAVQFAHGLSAGRLRLFKGMHHGLPMEAPQAFNAALKKFLRET